MSWTSWRIDFESHADRPLPHVTPDGLPPGLRAPMARILARFQLGEAGEGRVAKEIDRVHLPTIDADYRAALKLFVREEGRHARILALAVRALEGNLIQVETSTLLFRSARRLLGLRFKLLVFLLAEVLGGATYRALSEIFSGTPLSAALAEIGRDEARHLAFHAEFFRRTVRSSAARLGLALSFSLAVACALAVVLLENRRELRALPGSRRRIARRALADLHRVIRECSQ